MDKPTHPNFGFFWRFLVGNDKDVDRYIIRDADSVVSSREKACVDAWIKSEKHFHVMRDFLTQSELILAGLWGGVGHALPLIEPIINDFLLHRAPNKTLDQQFLRQEIWPTVRTSCLIHDSIHDLSNTTAFPKNSDLPTGKHVGQRHDIFFR